MPYREPKIEKVIFTIGEVAEMIGENPSLIRYWESRFEMLKPKKNAKGNRLFSHEEIEIVKLIHYLIKVRGLTIRGARQKLRENREETIHTFEIVRRLQIIRNEILEIRDGLITTHDKTD